MRRTDVRKSYSAFRSKGMGLRVNAGHGLHEGNVMPVAAIEELSKFNIGPAIVAAALFKGLQNAIEVMKALMVRVGHKDYIHPLK